MSYPEMTRALLTRCGLDAEGVAIVMAELERLNAELVTETAMRKTFENISHALAQEWEPLANHIATNPDAIPGQTTPETALAWLRERDALKSQLAVCEVDRDSALKVAKDAIDALGDVKNEFDRIKDTHRPAGFGFDET